MSKYVRSSFFDTEFDGDRVRVFLKALRQEDGLRVSALRASQDREAETSKLTSDLVLTYVEKIEGLVAGDGTPITVQEAASEMYFFDLRTRIMGEILSRAVPVATPDGEKTT